MLEGTQGHRPAEIQLAPRYQDHFGFRLHCWCAGWPQKHLGNLLDLPCIGASRMLFWTCECGLWGTLKIGGHEQLKNGAAFALFCPASFLPNSKHSDLVS